MARRALPNPVLPSSLLSSCRRPVAGLAVVAVTAAVLSPLSVAPASAAPMDCVTAAPVDELVAGQPLTGLTVTSGTTPSGFAGEVIDVLDDGVAPGVDMVLARIDMPEVDRAGIWAGMSGSPVYDADGRLVGAIAYSLSWGRSDVAGITPAADVLAVADRAEPVEAARQVAIPRASARAVAAASDDVSSGQAAEGATRLRTPVTVAGLSQDRWQQLRGERWLKGRGPVQRAAGAGATSAEPLPVVPGGNMAASLSHGTVTAAGLGTATAVCDDRVVGFGHPFNFTGDATYALHGARATHVQSDGEASGFKVANLGAPVGTVDQDRLAAISGLIGATPTAYPITVTATDGDRTRTAVTQVTDPSWFADLGISTVFAAGDAVRDEVGGGSAEVTWTVTGTRRDGTPFSLTRSDVYAEEGWGDAVSSPAFDLADVLYTLTDNGTEQVQLTSVDLDASFSDEATVWKIGRVRVRDRGEWRRVTRRDPLVVRSRRTRVLDVELYSRTQAPTSVRVPLTAPRVTRRPRLLSLGLTGGNGGGDYFEDESFYFEEFGSFYGGAEETVPQALRRLGAAIHNDELAVRLRGRGIPRNAPERRLDLGRVVSGSASLPVVVLPLRRR